MTNRELNEAIARLMGWEPCLGMVSDWKHPPSQTSMTLPVFLAPERLGELMDLADKVMGEWDVGTRGFQATADIPYEASVNLGDAREDDGVTKLYCGRTPSEALARAIVAHKEKP